MMSRVIVLILCLASAGGIAAYSHFSADGGEPTAVYTVPPRPTEPGKPPPATPPRTTELPPGDRAALTRALQRELKRVGCYSGEITGVWTTSSRMAMKAFTERVNASLPIDTPDQVLLSLVQGHQDKACGTVCPSAQTATEGGACVPNAVLAKAKPAAPADAAVEPPVDKSAAALPLAGAAAALATATAARPDPKTGLKTPADSPAADKKGLGERATRQEGPVPPEGVRERRPRRSAERQPSRPPKVVRDVLRALGLK
jgi:hypothetical protein